jgi:hypothetical protein
MTHPPCPTCGRPKWKPPPGVRDHSMSDEEEYCFKQGNYLCRAASAGRQAALRWRPMSEAPRDGIRVLLHDLSGVIATGKWDSTRSRWHCESNQDGIPALCGRPTHWLPLPEAPKEDPTSAPSPEPAEG